jgi:multidrug efflux pump
VFPLLPPSLGQSFLNRPVDVILQSSGGFAELASVAGVVYQRLQADPQFLFPDTDLKLDKPQLSVTIDRDRAAAAGVDVTVVGRTLETLFGGRKVTRFKRGSDQYDVIVQAAAADRALPADVSRAYVPGRDGAMVQLGSVVTVVEAVAPPELNHFNKLRSANVKASLAPGADLGAALATVERHVRELAGNSVQVDYAGISREFRESGRTLLVTFALALAFIYLVLAAQFESWIDPFVILLSVPLALTGGLLAQKLSGGTLNIYSQIGLITLVGLVSKHGILIVDFANRLQAEGRDRAAAVAAAAALRLRPILMTTGAMIFGALPLALATGAGAEARRQIGWVVVGGMTLGTLLTLFVVPTVYTLIGGRHRAAAQL